MPDEELDQEGLDESEAAMMAEYEAEGELPEGEATGEGEPQPEAVVQAEPTEEETAPVPSYRLREETLRRQEAERKLELLAQRTDALLSQIQQVTTPAPEQPPDRYEDPVGYLQWQNDQLLARTTENQTRAQQYLAQQEQERAAQTFLNDYNQTIQEFAQRTPDYKAATEFLADSRRRELESLGITDPEQIKAALWQDSLTIAAHAKSQGKNHAEIFYNLAKQRGFQGGVPQQQPAQAQPKQTLETVRKGATAATSLSNVGGGGANVELTAEALIHMTDDEFQAATSGKKWRQIHGR